MAVVAGAAIVVRLLGFDAQAEAASQPMLNVMQYGVPVLVVGICAAVVLDPRLAMGR